MQNYKYVDHTADIAVEIAGTTYEDLFSAAFFAWQNSAIEIKDHSSEENKEVILSEDSYEELLVHFVDEMNFLLTVRNWVPVSVDSLRLNSAKEIKLDAVISGRMFNPDKHNLKAEIKAVTFHQVDIKKINDEYRTLLVFDI